MAIQVRVAHPLLPMRVIADRDRGSSYLSMALTGAGMFAVFLFLTYYLQTLLGYTPIGTGLAFLPMIAGIAVGAQISGQPLVRVGPRPLVPAGMAAAAIGMFLFTQLSLDSTYVVHILPGLILAGLGLGFVIAPSMQTATSGIEAHDAGVASATVNTVQQVGGSIGTAAFSTLAASASTSWAVANAATAGSPDLAAAQSALEGYLTVFGWASGVFAVGAVLALALLRSGVQERDPEAEPVFAH